MPSAYAENKKDSKATRDDIGGLMAELSKRPHAQERARKLTGPERAAVLMLSLGEQYGAKIFGLLSEKNVSVDMIIQSPSRGGGSSTDVTFTVAKTDLARVKELIESTVKELGGGQVEYDPEIAKVSIVGLGMRSHAGVAAKTFGILAAEGINIMGISTSEIKISCIIAAKYTELAVRALHDGFELEKAP